MEKKISTDQLKIQHKELLCKLKQFEVRSSDVFLLGYPKSGTTWAQEMIWLLVNNLNYEGAKAFVDERVPVLELALYLPKEIKTLECHRNSIEFAKKMENPRCIKSHLNWDFIPTQIIDGTQKPKIIYIARNPKDVCVSSYYYYKNIIHVLESHCALDDFSYFFMSEDFQNRRNYWDHLLYFWERRNEPNILFIKYEDMKDNLLYVVRKMAKFLEKTLTEEEEIRLLNWLDFETMKSNPAVNHESTYGKSGFIRSGKTDEHKKEMSAEVIKKFDSWIEENLKGSDYQI